MTTMRCETARLWLQAPDELRPDQMRVLDEHLAGCGECRLRRQQYWDVDIRLWAEMDGVRMPASARARVLEHIAFRQADADQSRRTLRHVLSALAPIRSVLARVFVRASLAAIAVGLALGLPRVLPESGSLLEAGAAWHLQPPPIGYHLAVDWSTPDHLLAGAAGQVYESWNAGADWHRLGSLPAGLTVRAVLVDRAHSNRYLVATDHSIYVSVDRGRHWTQTAQSMPGAYNMFLLQDARNPATIYVGPSILWKSTNEGDTWGRAGPGTVFAPWGIQTLKNGPGGTLYTGIWGGGVAVSRNNGATWHRRAGGLAPHVVGLSVAPGGTVWAATDRGVYTSRDASQIWHRAGHLRFAATTVLATRTYVLAGGDHVLYRSDNGGTSWKLSMEGLPLDPYVYDVEADPFHSGRVYAVLNGDGLFRSDDEGRHWTPIDTGIPLDRGSQKTDLVLFIRNGALWHTDSQGTDPGVSTVETDVRFAAPAPDNASLAYVASFGSDWGVRVMSASGSGALTVAAGSTDMPVSLAWSPNSAMLAIAGRSHVLIAASGHRTRAWRISSDERLLGWSTGGNTLLFWDPSTGAIVRRSWATGRPESDSSVPGHYPALPAISSDGSRVAYVWGAKVYVGRAGHRAEPIAAVGAGCARVMWSASARRLLVSCSGRALEVSTAGTVLARIAGATDPQWAPGSDGDVLYFRRGALWKWTENRTVREIARPAAPAELFAMAR